MNSIAPSSDPICPPTDPACAAESDSAESEIIPHFADDANAVTLPERFIGSALSVSLPRFVSSAQSSSVPACTSPPQPVSAAPSGADPIPSNVRYREQICHAAQSHGLNPLLLAAVAAQETGGPGADSGANVLGSDGTGHGVFQIDSGSWQTWLTSHHNGMDVAENADKAASILADNLRATGGDVKKALHLYNAGSEKVPSTATTWPDHSTLDYESSVMRHLALLSK